MNKIIRYLLQGILFTVPVAITVYVIVTITNWVGSAVDLLGISIHPLIDPLLGLIGGVTTLIIIGAIGSSIFFYPLFKRIELLIEKTPFLNLIFEELICFSISG